MSNINERKNHIKNGMDDAEITDVALVYPHQLFEENPAVAAAEHVFLIEEPLFFQQYQFHKKKLILHKASMRWYADSLSAPVTYISAAELEDTTDIFEWISDSVECIHVARVCDNWLKRRISNHATQSEYAVQWHNSPLFMLSDAEVDTFITDKSPYRLESFYRKMRKEKGVLMDDGEPEGGEWNYDKQNRESLSEDITLPDPPTQNTSKYVEEAREYVKNHFDSYYGEVSDFYYPVTRDQAVEWLDRFLKHRFAEFGPYQDAISKENHTLFHSMISPLLNIGLLTPSMVVKKALDVYEEGDIPLQSVEGFVRQVLGWREFMRVMYKKEGAAMRTKNIFDFQKEMPDAVWAGKTGLPPVDDAIEYVRQHGYAHHIERLMIFSNFMLLAEINPESVYEWFMTMFVDAYDWVMVPNVYDMGQYASGGIFATKPYISSSNYIMKMSDYEGGEWADIWGGLYWRFLSEHADILEDNHRMGLVMHQLDNMNEGTLEEHRRRADEYLSDLS